MASENKNLMISGLASAALHGLVVAFGCLDIFEPQINNDMFLNIELAGAAEMQQALDDYNNDRSIIEKPQPKIPEQKEPEHKEAEQKEIQQEEPQPEQQPNESPVESEPKEIHEDLLVKGPSIVEPRPEPISESDSEAEPEPDPESEEENQPQESEDENALPAELQNLRNEEILRLEEERLEQEKKLEQERMEKEKAKQEQLRKEEERRRKKERQKKLREKKLKKKKEAARRRKKRLEAIKRIEKKNKERKNRLAKIADAVKKNEEKKKKKKNNAFAQMLKKEKNSLSKSSYGKPKGNGMGNGNGLGSYGDGMGLTDSDAAIISSQIIPHWVVAGGVKNAETLIIRIRIKVKDNGEVPASSVEILDKARYNSDRVFKSAADSAKRAILQASPLKIPAEKMHLFRDFEFSFNTDKALGVKK